MTRVWNNGYWPRVKHEIYASSIALGFRPITATLASVENNWLLPFNKRPAFHNQSVKLCQSILQQFFIVGERTHGVLNTNRKDELTQQRPIPILNVTHSAAFSFSKHSRST